MKSNVLKMDDYRPKSVVEPSREEVKTFLFFEMTTRMTLQMELQALANLYPTLLRTMTDDAEVLIEALKDPTLSIESMKNLKAQALKQVKQYEEMTGQKVLPSYL